MCCTSVSICKIVIFSNFSIFFLVVLKIFFHKHIILWQLDVILVFSHGNIFFFLKIITFVAFSLRELQNFFTQFSPRYKLCLFSTLSKAHIVDIEYLPGICSLIFIIEGFSGLFAHPSIF